MLCWLAASAQRRHQQSTVSTKDEEDVAESTRGSGKEFNDFKMALGTHRLRGDPFDAVGGVMEGKRR